MTDDRVTVRRAVESDDQALLAIELSAWDASSGFPSFHDPAPETFFTDRAGPEAHLIAEDEGELVGYVRLQDGHKLIEGAGVLAINGLAVAPNARGRGVGSILLEAATAEGKRRGARKIKLHVFATNLAAQRLYERHGYVVEGVHKAEFFIENQYIDDLALAKFL